MKRVALATFGDLPELADDERPLLEELRRRGVEACAAVWDSPSVRWDNFDAVVVRSCWDYHLRPREFLAWIGRLEDAGVPLWNPPSLLRWNVDKRYLESLRAKGLPVVATERLEAGSAADLSAIFERRGWESAVVKPAVSAGAFQTFVASPRSVPVAQAEIEGMLAGGSAVLVQQFVEEIRTSGEWSFVFLGGEYSHAVLKRPKPGDFRVQAQHGGAVAGERPASPLVAQAKRAIGAIRDRWLYARVDGIDIGGRLLLIELELVEPSLYLGHEPLATRRFANATCAALGR